MLRQFLTGLLRSVIRLPKGLFSLASSCSNHRFQWLFPELWRSGMYSGTSFFPENAFPKVCLYIRSAVCISLRPAVCLAGRGCFMPHGDGLVQDSHLFPRAVLYYHKRLPNSRQYNFYTHSSHHKKEKLPSSQLQGSLLYHFSKPL